MARIEHTCPESDGPCIGSILLSLPNCRSCGILYGCEYKPAAGEYMRFNCPLYIPRKDDQNDG